MLKARNFLINMKLDIWGFSESLITNLTSGFQNSKWQTKNLKISFIKWGQVDFLDCSL